MAHDLILGGTGTNWSRGIQQLLPHTLDSTSMGRGTAPSRQLASAHLQVQRAMAANRGTPVDNASPPEEPSSASSSSSSSSPGKAIPDDDADGSLNDDELTVARDGGSSERAALSRIRGR